MYIQGRDNSIVGGLDVGCKGKEAVEEHFKVFGLNNWKDKVAISWDDENRSGEDLGWKIRSSVGDMLNFKMLI